MGLNKESIYLLMKEGLRHPFRGKLVTLGKQDVSATHEEVKSLARKCGYSIRTLQNLELSDKPLMREMGMISDRDLFNLLGFDEIKSIDASHYENADIIYDLNQDNLPSILHESADIVLDAGTIEHVFHVPNSLKNIFQLLRVTGRVIHIAPSSNYMDHGFYMFSPTLFFDYYTANHFQLQPLNIIRHKPQAIFPWKISSYNPGSLNSYCFGGLDSAMYAIYCIATKMPTSSYHKIPQQYYYANNLWKSSQPSPNFAKMKKLVKKLPILYRILVFANRVYKRFSRLRTFRKSLSN